MATTCLPRKQKKRNLPLVTPRPALTSSRHHGGGTPAYAWPQLRPEGAHLGRIAQVPLDVSMQYYFRAKRSTYVLPPERAEWTAGFRESVHSLDTIIKDVYTARDADWLPSTPVELFDSGEEHASSWQVDPRKQVARVLRGGAAPNHEGDAGAPTRPDAGATPQD